MLKLLVALLCVFMALPCYASNLNQPAYILNSSTVPAELPNAVTLTSLAIPQGITAAYYCSVGALPNSPFEGPTSISGTTNGALAFPGTGYTPAAGDIIVVQNGNLSGSAPSPHNGVYVIYNPGSPSTPWELVRASFFNSTSNITQCGPIVVRLSDNIGVVPSGGAVYCTTPNPTVGTSNISFSPVANANAPLYTSAQTTFTLSSVTSFSHGLGRAPYWIRVQAICTTANAGYTVGQYIDMTSMTSGSGAEITCASSTTTISVALGPTLDFNNATTGAQAVMTAADWKMIVSAW
jgi:hypothetical protein